MIFKDLDSKGNGSIPDNVLGIYSGYYTGQNRIMRYGRNTGLNRNTRGMHSPFNRLGGLECWYDSFEPMVTDTDTDTTAYYEQQDFSDI